MIKIPYPIPSKDFDNDYITALSSANKNNFKEGDNYLKGLTYKGKSLNVYFLLVAKFHELLEILELIDLELTALQKDKLNSLFNYKGSNQKLIASFFMQQSYIEMESCYCCNIDYVNSFKDVSDYKTPEEFINKAQLHELIQLYGIKKDRANVIRDRRPYNSVEDVPYLQKKAKKMINDLSFLKSKNHFTLDHFLPQSKFKYLSLCLYNLVPSCYSCNTKFKRDKEFDNPNDLKYVSPSSKDFSLMDDFSFEIYYPKDLKDIKKSTDYKLRKNISNNDDVIQEYLNMFKIEGRYVFHKKELLTLINKKIKYPESTLKKIARTYGLTIDELRSNIFGEELFDPSFDNKPLVKFKRDIAKDIKIKGIL